MSEKKLFSQEIYSKQFPNGAKIEIALDLQKNKTSFWIFENGKISQVENYKKDEMEYFPVPACNGFFQNKMISLPLKPEGFVSMEKSFQRVKSFIHQYVEVSESFESICAWYVILTWVFDHFDTLPYLRVIGDLGTGKSRFLNVLQSISYRSTKTSAGSSLPAFVRIAEMIQGTLIIDEMDIQDSRTTNPFIKFLNCGYEKGSPFVKVQEIKRGKIKSYTPISYDIFGCKILAGREKFLDDAIESRCLTHYMKERTRNDICISTKNADFEKESLSIRNMLFDLRFFYFQSPIKIVEKNFESITARLLQIMQPIFSIAELSGNQKEKDILVQFLKQKQQEIDEIRFSSFEGEIFQSFLLAKKENAEPLIGEIAKKYEKTFRSRYPINSRRIGALFSSVFHLSKRRTNNGFLVENSQKNNDQIEVLKSKYFGTFDQNRVNE